MNFSEKKEIPPKYIYLFLTIVCLLMLFISLLFEDVFTPLRTVTGFAITPMQKGINSIGNAVSDRVERLQNMQELIETNQRLEETVQQFVEENKEYQLDMYELERLKRLYALDNESPDIEKVGARVISMDATNWFNIFVIDKGSDDGIQEGCNVLAGEGDGGLAGIVIEVGKDYAKVRAIIDDYSNVYANVLASDTKCNVKGDLAAMEEDGYIQIELIDKADEISEGDAIVTSHISPNFLPGILIGYATEIKLDTNNLTKSAKLLPAVNFQNLQEVLVIKELKQTVEDTEE